MKTTCKNLAKHFQLCEQVMRRYLDRFSVPRIREGRRIYYDISLSKIETINKFLREKGYNYDELTRLRKQVRTLKSQLQTLEKLRDYIIDRRGQIVHADEIMLLIGI